MFSKTNQSYGVNEVLLASVLGSVVFSLFAAQPLVIVGVTGKFPTQHYHVTAPLTNPRSNHCLQLHSLRHRRPPQYQLLPIHVLDRHLGSHHALDPRHHQRLQCPDVRHSILVRHLWLLRRLHLPTKGHPGLDSTMALGWGHVRVPGGYGLAPRARLRLWMWHHWRKQTLPKTC
jgi:hypothetical protein